MMLLYLLIPTLHIALASSPVMPPSGTERAKQLKEFIKKEKPRFDQREFEKKSILEALDRLNAEENQVRERISLISQNQQELNMALDNLTLESEKQKRLETVERARMLLLLKVAYKVKKEGLIRFLIFDDNLSTLANRVRVLYRTLRSHTLITQQLKERASRLGESERKLAQTKEDMKKVLGELQDQEGVLGGLLEKKRRMLRAINQKQSYYQAALNEYKQISTHLTELFSNFESMRDSGDSIYPKRGSLKLPIDAGRIVKNFGRFVNERFGTILFHKGIEIETEQNSPVNAILPGIVEYEGWVKGLGNVVILHHGGGFYSLSAHLFKNLKPQGTHVQAGEAIGLVGDTGQSEKPSLYFEIRENGKAVDPLTYFSTQALNKFH